MYRIDSLGEEIGRDDGIQIRVDKRAPGYRRLTDWGRGSCGNTRLPQYGAHGCGSNPDTELLELTVRGSKT